jgi:predicted cupin superfamily sugar epimerase
MSKKRIALLAEKLELLPHPEGGFFKETFRSKETISKEALDNNYSGDRNLCTSIYFLLTSDNFSAFHRIKQDEIWHFYEGSPLYVHVIDQSGNYTRHSVGLDIENGQVPQLTVPAGCWFGSSVAEENSYSFVGCTVAPGFDFDDFELASYAELAEVYPLHSEVIRSLTRI